jgi:hypothetical protein
VVKRSKDYYSSSSYDIKSIIEPRVVDFLRCWDRSKRSVRGDLEEINPPTWLPVQAILS